MATTPSNATAPELGTVLGEGYRLVRYLGAGGLGAVYEAIAPGSEGNRVALKVVLQFEEADQAAMQRIERFKREAYMLATLESAHLVPLLDAGFDQARKIPFLVMPLLVGVDLKEAI